MLSRELEQSLNVAIKKARDAGMSTSPWNICFTRCSTIHRPFCNPGLRR
ncbi:MAG: hypothetical protein Ct9H300mP16_11590 [Pseudomonadota bacterium]|nr:MAG: hypothetical protein Ct9H300mP16_11590 [Pseudomonadota bacterium]